MKSTTGSAIRLNWWTGRSRSYTWEISKTADWRTGSKLFELKFQEEAEEPAQVLLHQALVTVTRKNGRT